MKKYLSLLLTLALIFSLAGPAQTVSAATVKLNKSNLSLTEGATFTLKVSGTKSKVTWSSSKKTVATVSAKGVVSAKKAGSTTVSATVNKKKYTCKVTVVEQFNATAASKNIKSELFDTGSGVIAILKNNNKYSVSLDATMVYMDASGKAIGKSTADNYYFEAGKECALSFSAPYDSNYDNVQYSSYKISYKLSELSSSIKSALSDIVVDSNIGVDNVMVNVKNESTKSPEFTIVSIVFYKDGAAVGYNYSYAHVESSGSEDYLDFSYPYDSNYETIQIDDYKVFVNGSYYYTW